MNHYQFAAQALIGGIAAPLMWLAARYYGLRVDAWIVRRARLLREKVRQRLARRRAAN